VKKALYITTPIYYVTDKPHIGHLYTTLAADISARYYRLLGEPVWFLTGTDEHGQKIEKKAKETGETPGELADRVVERYKEAWKLYGVEYDDFIRTTEPRHKNLVHKLVQKLMDSGDIYLGTYEGWYCVPDEAYWSESQLNEGKCPDCGRVVERLQEESYFFKLSKYAPLIAEHIQKNPGFISPESRRNEVLGFLKQDVRDISASRTTIEWGIPFPTGSKATKSHTVYVWFDALTNYLSAIPGNFGEFSTRTVHLVGKDILRFHAVYWPGFLMALGLPLPDQIVAHGWLTDANRKIGKSLGNAVDPLALAEEVGVDGVRYFLFREFIFGSDGEYTKQTLYNRINADLANDYGNCLSRVANMIPKYFGTEPFETATVLSQDSVVKQTVEAQTPLFHSAMQAFHFDKALAAAWKITAETNKYIEDSAPWALAKTGKAEDLETLRKVLAHCHEALRVVSLLAYAFIPTSAAKALEVLGVESSAMTLKTAEWAKGPSRVVVRKSTPLFPRLEWKES
jgi:methionyl-tRNA synthetase